MRKFQCPSCDEKWLCSHTSLYCPCCAVPCLPPQEIQSPVEGMKGFKCSLCTSRTEAPLGAVRCPACAVKIGVKQAEKEASSQSDRVTIQKDVPDDIQALGPEIRKVLGKRVGPRRALCLGCSKDITRVFLATDADDISLVSLDRNFVKERLEMLSAFCPHTLIALMREGATRETAALMPTNERSRRFFFRFYDMGYDSFFAKYDARVRFDLIIDKMSWLPFCPAAFGHYLGVLKVGGFWITDLRLAPRSEWILGLLGLEDVTELLPKPMRSKYWGYTHIQLYRKVADRPLSFYLGAMFYWCEVLLPTIKLLIDLDVSSSVPVGDMKKHVANAELLKQLAAWKCCPKEVAAAGLKWWTQALEMLGKAAANESEPDEKEVQIQVGTEVTWMHQFLLNEFPHIAEEVRLLEAEEKKKPEDDRRNPGKLQALVLAKYASEGMTLESKKGTFLVLAVPKNPFLAGLFRLRRTG